MFIKYWVVDILCVFVISVCPMSITRKFQSAKYFDHAQDDWVVISPSDYVPELHKGKLECETNGCHAAISYVSAYSKNANDNSIAEHFKTNQFGQEHAEYCPLDPDPQKQASLKMMEAMMKGLDIQININFTTSWIRNKGRLSKRVAKKALPKFDSYLRTEWNKANEYAPFGAKDAEALSTLVRAFHSAIREVGGKPDQLMMAYLNGVTPLSKFWAKNALRQPNENALTVARLFSTLYEEMQSQQSVSQSYWSPVPMLRKDLSLWGRAKFSKGGELYTNYDEERNVIGLRGQNYLVQDVVVVRDPSVRQAIQNADKFSLIATPYIKTGRVEKAIRDYRNIVQVNWPINSTKQLILS